MLSGAWFPVPFQKSNWELNESAVGVRMEALCSVRPSEGHLASHQTLQNTYKEVFITRPKLCESATDENGRHCVDTL